MSRLPFSKKLLLNTILSSFSAKYICSLTLWVLQQSSKTEMRPELVLRTISWQEIDVNSGFTAVNHVPRLQEQSIERPKSYLTHHNDGLSSTVQELRSQTPLALEIFATQKYSTSEDFGRTIYANVFFYVRFSISRGYLTRFVFNNLKSTRRRVTKSFSNLTLNF